MTRCRIAASGLILALGAVASAQDSVPVMPGGNDALSPFDPAAQRTRYVVDAVPVMSSWGRSYLVAPILKASRDLDPAYRTQILGAAAVSPGYVLNPAFASRTYSLWTTPGAGVHPTANSAPGSTSATTFSMQFGVGLSDFSQVAGTPTTYPTNLVGAIVGRNSSNLSRLYVERVALISSRPSSGAGDTCTLSLGGVDQAGDAFLRADNFNTVPATTTRITGDNIVRIDAAARGGSVNSLAYFGSNIAADFSSTIYVADNETTPTNTPTGVLQTGVSPFGLAFDFASRFRTGSSSVNLTTTTTHLAIGIAGHRGNPTFSPATAAGGAAGTVASLAQRTGAGAKIDAMNVFGLTLGAGGAPPTITPGTPRAFTIPSLLSGADGFFVNVSNNASARQYLSQSGFRGGNGEVGVGANAAGQLVIAAVAFDPAMNIGDFIAVVTATGPSTSVWTLAAHAGQNVLDGPTGAAIGTLNTPTTTFSAPAVDRLGNVYFVATWKPTLLPVETGLFKAVNLGGASGYRLEKMLSTGQQITGANSTRVYTITALALADSDSIASAAFHSQQLIQDQATGATTTDPAAAQAFGGLIVNSTITYNNAGQNEAYDAVLFVGPSSPACAIECDGVAGITIADIFCDLSRWFAQNPYADWNHNSVFEVGDIFGYLAAWFAGC